MALAYPVLAQDYQQLAPKVPAPNKPGQVAEPEPKLTPSKDADTILLPQLKGLVFLSSPAEVKAEGLSGKKGVDLSLVKVPEPEAYKALAEAYIGQKLTKGKLDALIRETVIYYRTHDRPVVDVIVPEQDITSGVVQILLLEGKVGHVSASGNRWFSSNILTGDLHATPGEPISASRLQADLDWINQNPFRSSNLLFSPGAQLGQTDLTLQVQDRFPARFYAGYENSGNKVTGYDRYITGVNLGDVWGLGHQANYQYTSSGDFTDVQGHAGSYIIPLPWRHTLTFFGSYATSKSNEEPISLTGVSWQSSARYDIPLEVISIEDVGKLRQNFSFGFDFKQSNNNLGFGGTDVYASQTDVAQWVAGYKLTLNDPYGATSVSLSLTYSPGNLTENNNNAAFDVQRAGASASYAYETFMAERTTRLPWDFSWILRGTVQTTNENLLGSEQLGFGGYNTIRGYDMNAVMADEGFLFTTELRTPAISLVGLFSKEAGTVVNDKLQFLVFWDYGQGNNYALADGESSTTNLSSVGPGVRYTINSYLSLRFDYGWQLHTLANDPHHGSHGDLGLVLSY
jgi:hemolysin activation/secretion protein